MLNFTFYERASLNEIVFLFPDFSFGGRGGRGGKRVRLHLTKQVSRNNRDEDLNNASSFF